jgi:ABC-2 type transport system ATP-binding protein
MVKLEQLTKEFNSNIAVDQLTFEVKEGEVFGLLGPNGAGKTTTVRMLSSLIGPTSGTAYVNHFEIQKDDQDIRRSVGILTETPGLYDNLSAEYNLEIFANLYEVKNLKGQIEKYLRLLGLWERRFDLAGTFSKGMKQKLAIARALLHEPRVLFLDEPTSGLDPESAKTVRDFISELREQGRTIFICTHNLDEADRLCDRIGVVKTRLLVIDTPEKLRLSLFGKQVVFHLAAFQDHVPARIRKFEYVQGVEVLDNKLLVTVDDPESRNPEIIRTLIQEGVDIQFVGEHRHSLEDVYLRLMQDV